MHAYTTKITWSSSQGHSWPVHCSCNVALIPSPTSKMLNSSAMLITIREKKVLFLLMVGLALQGEWLVKRSNETNSSALTNTLTATVHVNM